MVKHEHERFTTTICSFCISCGSEHIEMLRSCSADGGIISALYYCYKQHRIFKISSEDVKYMSDEGYGRESEDE